jgi:hypothetical protein
MKPEKRNLKVILFAHRLILEKCDNWSVELVPSLQEIEFENE